MVSVLNISLRHNDKIIYVVCQAFTFYVKNIQFHDFGGGVTNSRFVSLEMVLYEQLTIQIKANMSRQFCDYL